MTCYALYYGRSTRPLLFIVPDPDCPPMYRIQELDGHQSGMLNLTRAREAGRLLGRNLVRSNDPTDLHWKEWRQGAGGRPTGAPKQPRATYVALRYQNAPTATTPQ